MRQQHEPKLTIARVDAVKAEPQDRICIICAALKMMTMLTKAKIPWIAAATGPVEPSCILRTQGGTFGSIWGTATEACTTPNTVRQVPGRRPRSKTLQVDLLFA